MDRGGWQHLCMAEPKVSIVRLGPCLTVVLLWVCGRRADVRWAEPGPERTSSREKSVIRSTVRKFPWGQREVPKAETPMWQSWHWMDALHHSHPFAGPRGAVLDALTPLAQADLCRHSSYCPSCVCPHGSISLGSRFFGGREVGQLRSQGWPG